MSCLTGLATDLATTVACGLGAGGGCFAASSALAFSTNGCNIGIEVGLK